MESSSKKASAQWRPRQYVLLGMAVILAASTLTMVTSMLLRPTKITFSATDFSSNTTDDDRAVVFVFNLVACNPSRRVAVVYRSVLVSMQLRNGRNPSVRETAVPALMINGIDHPRNSNKTIPVTAVLDREFYKFYSSKPSAKIRVFAMAQFKVGFAMSRVYNIRVGCDEISLSNFPTTSDKHSRVANCSAL